MSICLKSELILPNVLVAEGKCQGWERWKSHNCLFLISLHMRSHIPHLIAMVTVCFLFIPAQLQPANQSAALKWLSCILAWFTALLHTSHGDNLWGFLSLLHWVSWRLHKAATCSGLTELCPCVKCRDLGFKVNAVLREKEEKHTN